MPRTAPPGRSALASSQLTPVSVLFHTPPGVAPTYNVPLVSGSKMIERIYFPAKLFAASQLAPLSPLLNKPWFVPAKMRLELNGSIATESTSDTPDKPEAAAFHVDPASVLVNTETG